MAKNHTSPQNYPRTSEGFLDETQLTPHSHKLTLTELKEIIRDAVQYANKKSSRKILNISEDITRKEKKTLFLKEGKELFNYFRKYYGDPATTAHECFGRHYSQIAMEQFRNRTLQMERMNSGWRYQYMAKDCAVKSKRFISVSDIGTAEADFTATIGMINSRETVLNIFTSVKNRTNTMGGQDWPKAIYALEGVAQNDKNRNGPYICIFGIAMDRGQRIIKFPRKSPSPYSVNTEIWLSDFFWPFFSDYSYQEIITAVLDTLIEEAHGVPGPSVINSLVPKELIESFGDCCRRYSLVDSKGNFNDPHKLVELFCTNAKGTTL